jgi:hypothetical protein
MTKNTASVLKDQPHQDPILAETDFSLKLFVGSFKSSFLKRGDLDNFLPGLRSLKELKIDSKLQ